MIPSPRCTVSELSLRRGRHWTRSRKRGVCGGTSEASDGCKIAGEMAIANVYAIVGEVDDVAGTLTLHQLGSIICGVCMHRVGAPCRKFPLQPREREMRRYTWAWSEYYKRYRLTAKCIVEYRFARSFPASYPSFSCTNMRTITQTPRSSDSTFSHPPSRCTVPSPRQQMDRADARIQCRILRILLMIPVYSVTTMFSYVWYWHAVYWKVARDCYEAFAIAAFFALLCQFVAPQLGSQKEYFATMPVRPWPWPANWFNKCVRGKLRAPRSGLTWFNVSSRYWL